MPRKPNAEVLARMDCETPGCGERVAVLQNTKGYLYTRCPECKTNQGNGRPRQVFVWQHCEPIPGAIIDRPPNVPEEAGPIGGKLTGQAPAAIVVEPKVQQPAEPVQEPKVQTPKGEPKVQEQEGEQGQGGGAVFWLLLAGVGLAVGKAMGSAKAA